MTPIILFIFLALCLLGGYVYGRSRKRHKHVVGNASPAPLRFQDYRLPDGVFFHPGHTWAWIQPDGSVKIGINDFLRRMAGQAGEIGLPEVGGVIALDESLFTLPVDGAELHIRPPMPGTILARNPDTHAANHIGSSIEELERDWLIRMQPDDLGHDLPTLNIADRARAWLEKEVDRFREFLLEQAQRPALAEATLPDGGEPIVGVLAMLDEKGLQLFERQFLQSSDPSSEH